MIDYVSRYGLESNPFLKNGKFIPFETSETKEVAARLDYLADTKGFGVLTGSPGLGKTTCSRMWANKLPPSRFRVVYSSLSSVTVMDFYRQISLGLGVEPRYRKSDIFFDIQSEVNRYTMEKKITPVLVIDEASMLSHKILHDLQLMFNFEMDSRDRAIILLIGLPQLNVTLNQGIHESLRQRIVMNYHMSGISKEEGRLYVRKKLEGAGSRQTVFQESALEALLNSANGTPRMINKLCDRSMMIGASQGQDIIDAETVRKAIEDIQLG